MFLPNTRCSLYRRSLQTDRRGEYVYAPPATVPCSVVALGLMTEKTSVRADSSGSRGKAQEEQGDAMILFPTYITVKEGDLVQVEGEGLEIVAVFPRRDVLGRLDHIEVKLMKAQLP